MLKEKLNLDVQLLRGSNGIFEVAVDGKVVAAKDRTGFPSEQTVVSAVGAALGSNG